MGTHRNVEDSITYIFEDNQGVKRGINPRLARRQGLSKESVDKIIELHKKAYDILDAAKTLEKDDTPKYYNEALKALEFNMQEVWGFSQDANYHTWWLNMPGCTCPQMDNRDPAYYGRGRIISGDCPIHGG
jgi:hypothetical protein